MPRKCREKPLCAAPGCVRLAVSVGYCDSHRRRIHRGQDANAPLVVRPKGRREGFESLHTAVRAENYAALRRVAKARGLSKLGLLDEVLTAWRHAVEGEGLLDEDAAVAELREASRRTEESVRVLREMLAGPPVSEQTGHRI